VPIVQGCQIHRYSLLKAFIFKPGMLHAVQCPLNIKRVIKMDSVGRVHLYREIFGLNHKNLLLYYIVRAIEEEPYVTIYSYLMPFRM